MIVGQEQPDAGELAHRRDGEDQLRRPGPRRPRPEKNVWELVSDGLDYIKVGHVEMPSRAYVGAFGFKGPDQQKPARRAVRR